MGDGGHADGAQGALLIIELDDLEEDDREGSHLAAEGEVAGGAGQRCRCALHLGNGGLWRIREPS